MWSLRCTVCNKIFCARKCRSSQDEAIVRAWITAINRNRPDPRLAIADLDQAIKQQADELAEQIARHPDFLPKGPPIYPYFTIAAFSAFDDEDPTK